MMDENNKAGTQITKKIIDNIINENDANNPRRKELKNLADEYQNAYSANIKDSFEAFWIRWVGNMMLS